MAKYSLQDWIQDHPFPSLKANFDEYPGFLSLAGVRVTTCGIFNRFCLLASRYYHY